MYTTVRYHTYTAAHTAALPFIHCRIAAHYRTTAAAHCNTPTCTMLHYHTLPHTAAFCSTAALPHTFRYCCAHCNTLPLALSHTTTLGTLLPTLVPNGSYFGYQSLLARFPVSV
jgi:hypothetical protein